MSEPYICSIGPMGTSQFTEACYLATGWCSQGQKSFPHSGGKILEESIVSDNKSKVFCISYLSYICICERTCLEVRGGVSLPAHLFICYRDTVYTRRSKKQLLGVTLLHFNTGSEDSTQVTKLAQEALLPAESFYWTPTPLWCGRSFVYVLLLLVTVLANGLAELSLEGTLNKDREIVR